MGPKTVFEAYQSIFICSLLLILTKVNFIHTKMLFLLYLFFVRFSLCPSLAPAICKVVQVVKFQLIKPTQHGFLPAIIPNCFFSPKWCNCNFTGSPSYSCVLYLSILQFFLSLLFLSYKPGRLINACSSYIFIHFSTLCIHLICIFKQWIIWVFCWLRVKIFWLSAGMKSDIIEVKHLLRLIWYEHALLHTVHPYS